MYETIITLKALGPAAYDSYGNEVTGYTDTVVYALPLSVFHNEFYNAAQAGLHPSITFEIANRADYNGEKIVTYNGTDYDVVRVDWTAQRDKIRLVCEERTGER